MSVASEAVRIDTQGPSRSRRSAAEREPRAGRSRRATFIKWLRRVHGWVGLWGAAMGLLFGVTGFLLNHRGEPLRISTGVPRVATVQIAMPRPVPESPHALAQWLRTQHDLALPARLGRVQKDPAHPVAWGEHETLQPEHWQITFAGPRQSVTAEYWAGNDYVTLKRSDNALLASISNLHRGVGMSIGWVLFIDTFAGAMILLSLTGVLLWTELNRRKTIGAVIVLGSIVVAVWAGLA